MAEFLDRSSRRDISMRPVRQPRRSWSLNAEAYAATKLRVHGAALEALHEAIDAELPPLP